MIESDLKDFKCKIHENGTINRILKKSSSSKILFCTQCVIEADPAQNPFLFPYENFILNGVDKIDLMHQIRFTSEIPEDVQKLLQMTDEMIEDCNKHIAKQKETIQENCAMIKEKVSKMLEEVSRESNKKLDSQFRIFEKNINDFRKKVKRHFVEDESEPVDFSKKSYIDEINSSNGSEELEFKIRGFLTDLEEAEILLDPMVVDKQVLILESLKSFEKQIKSMNEKYPSVSLGDNEQFEKYYYGLNKQVESYLGSMSGLENEVFNLKAQSIDSKIATYQDLGLLRKWLSSKEGESSIKLLGRAKEDGSDFDRLMQRALATPKVLVLLKTNNGEVLGTYRVFKRGALTFSLTNKTMFREITDPMQKMGIYSISPSFRMTWNQKSRYNLSFYDRIEMYGLSVKPEKSICIGEVVPDNIFLREGEEKEYYGKIIHGADQLEVFEVKNNNKDLEDRE